MNEPASAPGESRPGPSSGNLMVADRSSLIERLCGDDTVLRSEVEQLLREHDSRSPVSDGTAATVVGNRDAADEPREVVAGRIGPFKLLRLLGEGGMGCVYEAEQDSPRRTVALKVIQPGLVSRASVRRFERESQVLASLKHPGIAQVYQAGSATTVGGSAQPYFAMELVSGKSLTKFAAEQKLTSREKLNLLALVCDAVQHAHQRGVIHRDLKPGNVMVEQTGSAEAQPKILDFGIARLTDPETGESSAQTIRTEAGQIVGTLAYMSPEQVLADPTAIDTRTDIYALGVMGYELLAGRLPIDVLGKPLAAAAKMVLDTTPPTLGTIDPQLHGDAETIIATAMAKDRDRRYASAAEFAADIRRFLRFEPISARPASTLYLLSRFARRNRLLVGTAALAVAALVGGLIASTSMYLRSEDALAKARAEAAFAGGVNDYLISDILAAPDPVGLGLEVKVVDLLDRAGTNVSKRFADRPQIEAQVRDVLGSSYRQLGQFEKGAVQARRAAELFNRTLGPDDARTLTAESNLLNLVSISGEHQASITAGNALMERAERVLPPEHQTRLMIALILGNSLQSVGRVDEARTMIERHLPIAERALGADSDITVSMRQIEAVCLISARRIEEALPIMREQYESTVRRLGAANPGSLANLNNLIACLIDCERHDEAAKYAIDLVEGTKQTYGRNDLMMGVAYHTAAVAIYKSGDYPMAASFGVKACEHLIAAKGDTCWDVERATSHLKRVYTRLKQPDKVKEWRVRSLRIRLIAAGKDEAEGLVENMVTSMKELKFAGGEEPAEGLVGEMIRRRDELAPEGDKHRARYLLNLARLCVRTNLAAEAATVSEEAEAAVTTSDRASEDAALVALARAEAAEALGQTEAAAAFRRRFEELSVSANPAAK